MNAIINLSATEIAQAIAKGELSASEVVEAHIQRIEAVNPQLNAVVVPLFEQARAEATRVKAFDETSLHKPLYGVPITIKESFDVVGTPTTVG
ncbi:MAG: amidase, partial [Tolypothrix sp. T3-bin4]|nr:amidase [Tolypothrix sp. Co-bin9]MBD0303452.1 amidase [Tolypothrix sp. T3-bin4]